MIDTRVIQEVIDRSDIIDVISDFVDLKKKGNSYSACCPFHQEKTPSFIVSPARGTWHCFGNCQEGGNVISFVMKIKNITFVEAVKWLASKYGIIINDDYKPSHEQIVERQKKESMQVINDSISSFFVQNLHSNIGSSALKYAVNRWGKDFVQEKNIGFAPSDYNAIPDFIRRTGLNEDLALEMGIIKKSDTGRIYGFYRNRLMIPICDRFSRIIGFTARDLSGLEDTAKYLNSSNSLCYNKSESIFGIDVALRQAGKEDVFYCVEGAPDVLRLQLIGHNNAIAPLGGNWNEAQFESIKKYATKLCFIPDSDPAKNGQVYGPGIAYVRKHGRLAMKLGFTVLVREIPLEASNTKQDPDSYFTSNAKWNEVKEEDFILWYARWSFLNVDTTEEKSTAIKDIAEMIALLDDQIKEEMYISQLNQLYKGKNLWQNAINAAKKKLNESQQRDGKKVDIDLYVQYGFYEEKHQYYSLTKDGDRFMWSNFEMKPMFHIKDAINPKRLYKITNYRNQTEIVEMKQEDLISLAKFQQKVEGLGNFIWMATAKEMTKLKKYLYEQTETAEEITQLGWQTRGGFYAFGNGVFDTEWHPVDEYGIVRLDKANFYLPASSKIYRDDTKLFQFERKFVHLNYNSVTLHDYFQLIIEVFGDNAKVGICFLLATLFRDIVTGYTKTFPILNLFGPKGSGKSELGHSLMAFFIIENVPPNIQNSTIAAMADLVAQSANALVHIDEFKNNIDLDKREFLKGLWDGAGRSRMNMDRDKKREITSVDCGVILSGQEMATADIALFSRFVYLTFNCSEYNDTAKRKFNEMKEIRKRGLTHLTLQILRHRAKFETEFISNYNSCTKDLLDKLKEHPNIEDRIFRNWLIVLSAFRTLEGVLDIPFSYNDILKICVSGIVRQNEECKSNNELAQFWTVVSYLQQNGEIYNEGDYRIVFKKSLKTNLVKEQMVFPEPRKILMLRKNRVFLLYKKFGKMVGDAVLTEGSLFYYLSNSKEFLGIMPSVRFKNIQKGYEVTRVEGTGTDAHTVKESSVDRALCFDYDKLSAAYDINLEVYTGEMDSPEEDL